MNKNLCLIGKIERKVIVKPICINDQEKLEKGLKLIEIFMKKGLNQLKKL